MNIKTFLISVFLLLASFHFVYAANLEEDEKNIYFDQSMLITQQLELLRTRAVEAKHELIKLQHQQDTQTLSVENVNKQLLTGTNLEIAVAKSNFDSVNIELTESQQTINRLEKEVQEIENQINVVNIFGWKLTRSDLPSIESLRTDLNNQINLLELERHRLAYLTKLQNIASQLLQLYKDKYARIESLLKSQTMTQLREQQAKSEIAFEQDQNQWLAKLNILYKQLNQAESAKNSDKTVYTKLDSEIFYANENVNFSYIQMLIARYKDQLQQLKVSIASGTSITLLNKIREQQQTLTKQLTRVNSLLMTREAILEKRINFLSIGKEKNEEYIAELQQLGEKYKEALKHVEILNKRLVKLRNNLDNALQQELSSRQGLPGLDIKAWLTLGAQILVLPSLAVHVIKNVSASFVYGITEFNTSTEFLLICLSALWWSSLLYLRHFLRQFVKGLSDHEGGHINLKWVGVRILQKNLIDIAIIGNITGLFYLCGLALQSFSFLIYLATVWIFFKVIMDLCRLYLVESVHHRSGLDIAMYKRLRAMSIVGGLVTGLTVFVHSLPVGYEVKDLFARLFLLYLFVVSAFLLKSWKVLPGLITPHLVETRRVYAKRIIYLMGLLVPTISLVNSVIGLLGYVNLVFTFSWYEGVFFIIMFSYLVLRGLLKDGMEQLSQLLIRYVSNGWLWTEAFLKPIDHILRITLFLVSWSILFLVYGWDSQSPIVERLTTLAQYKLIYFYQTTITPLNIIELAVVISFWFWAAKWTREFVYRFVLSRTKDLGVRNSIAILSQYMMYAIGILVCLKVVGLDYRALAAVSTAFALGAGLGLRDLANNYASGFLLLIERPLRVGDTIGINGYEGEVTHLGSRAVSIRTWDHMEVLVPNAEIFSKTFVNWTANDNIVRTVINMKINRQDNPLLVQRLIHQVLNNDEKILKEPKTEVYIKELTDGVLEFEIRYFINLKQVKSRVSVRSDILISLWNAFEQHGIRPPYPQREIHIRGTTTDAPTFQEPVEVRDTKLLTKDVNSSSEAIIKEHSGC